MCFQICLNLLLGLLLSSTPQRKNVHSECHKPFKAPVQWLAEKWADLWNRGIIDALWCKNVPIIHIHESRDPFEVRFWITDHLFSTLWTPLSRRALWTMASPRKHYRIVLYVLRKGPKITQKPDNDSSQWPTARKWNPARPTFIHYHILFSPPVFPAFCGGFIVQLKAINQLYVGHHRAEAKVTAVKSNLPVCSSVRVDCFPGSQGQEWALIPLLLRNGPCSPEALHHSLEQTSYPWISPYKPHFPWLLHNGQTLVPSVVLWC